MTRYKVTWTPLFGTDEAGNRDYSAKPKTFEKIFTDIDFGYEFYQRMLKRTGGDATWKHIK